MRPSMTHVLAGFLEAEDVTTPSFPDQGASRLVTLLSKANGAAWVHSRSACRNFYDRVLTWVRKRCNGAASPKRWRLCST
jgi:hypothetical protein